MITEMGTRLRLLPHWCQTAGYIYLAAFLICSAFAYACPGNPCFRFISGNWNLVGMLNFAMIFLAIFSREKVEDEMTISIRVNALIYLVFFLFLIHMLVYLPEGSGINSAGLAQAASSKQVEAPARATTISAEANASAISRSKA